MDIMFEILGVREMEESYECGKVDGSMAALRST